jgi:hypothetical protein
MKNLKLFALICLICVSPAIKAELKLSPFVTDGCTMFLDGTPSKPGLWRPCCVEHDLRYWFGGSEADMNNTDLRLKECVQKLAGDYWATLIYNGVRAGHYSPIKNKYYWSWAWSVKREKTPLTPAETEYVLSELREMKVDEVNMDEFIKVNFPSTN